MKKLTRILTLVLAVMMLLSVLPMSAFAAEQYDVFLNHGPQGWGSEAHPLVKTQGQGLPLYHTRDDIFANYGMLPGYYVMNDQRVFIEWNTAYDPYTGRGTGKAYYDYYTADTPATLYAIWGYNIQLNADGGVFPATGNGVYLSYVANFNNSNYNDPLTDYEYCFPDYAGGAPVKPGCRRVMYNGSYAYGLLRNDLSFFTWEGPGQNLTIPPTGGAMPWSAFHCVNTHRGLSLEFVAIWEPSVTYDANGGSGYMDVDYLTFDYGSLWNYEYYYIKNSAYTKSGTYFTGWNTKPDGSGISVAPGTRWGGQMNNSDPLTLYAQWADGSTGHKHSYTSSVTKAATCTEAGIKTYKCACGSTYTESIAALGHNTKTTTVDATCTAEGKTITTCTRCSASVTQSIPALGHNYTTTTTSATCTTEGKSTMTCRRCGDTKTTTTPALGHKYDNGVFTVMPSCGVEGVKTYTCSACGNSYNEAVAALNHTFGDYIYNKDATCMADGTKTRTCLTCQAKETITAEGTKVDHAFYDYIANGDATCTEDGTMTAVCEYGCGESDTIKDVGSAKGHSLGSWTVTKLATETEKGIETRVCSACSYSETRDIPMIGAADNGDPYLSAYGVQLTVAGLKNVKDYFIAEGDWDTYRDVKNNMVVSIGAAKLGSKSEYTYTLPHHGRHTVYIRYNDGSYKVLKIDIVGNEPTYDINGLQLTVNNLGDLKVIRTAYGEFTTIGAMKKDATHRAFTAKNDVKGADSYRIQYRNNGKVTVAVCYNDGYTEFFYYDVEQKEPTMVQSGNTVTFGSLDGLYNIRYAPGEWATSSQIKNAPGAKALKPSAIDANGYITVTLKPGVYTFCVQYDDESYNYYKIVVE